MFLLDFHDLRKSDWRGIACNYVITRTPTQVASHARKCSSGSAIRLGENDGRACLRLLFMK